MRRLVVNADDFGFTRDVNAGIVEAYRDGILRSTTLMANGAAFDHAVETALAEPGLDVGCHFTLVGGRSVADPGRGLPRSTPELLAGLAFGRWSGATVEDECRAQIERIRAAGLAVSHIDTHKHTHLHPRVLAAVLRAARAAGIGWIRRPVDWPDRRGAGKAGAGRRWLSRGVAALGWRYLTAIEAAGLRSTDRFTGFQMTGLYDEWDLAALIRGLPEGSTEFMCHPGRCGDELRAARTRLKQSREAELRALTSETVRRAVEESGVQIVSFRELAAGLVS